MSASFQDIEKYGAAAWRLLGHLDEIKSLQERLVPHAMALVNAAPEVKALYLAIYPEDAAPVKAMEVKDIQSALIREGYKLNADGDYGAKTIEAMKQFQRKEGITVDGWFGPQTMKRLFHKVS